MADRAPPEQPIHGVLPIDKPAGPTSHDVVARARRALGERRIGHTGTLDPFASGLLLLCVGRATRIAEYLSGMDKTYQAVVTLGISTDTDDSTGRIVSERDASTVTRVDVERALVALRGDIMQQPPAYSAKKIAGERAYALARQGRAVALEPVPVHVAQLDITRFGLPEVDLDITCSSGTYIRAIARDIGAALGTGARLKSLRRTAVGPHRVERAIPLDILESDPARARVAVLHPLDALAAMPRVELGAADIAHITHGRAVLRDTGLSGAVALAADGELVAIAEADGERLRPRKVFL